MGYLLFDLKCAVQVERKVRKNTYEAILPKKLYDHMTQKKSKKRFLWKTWTFFASGERVNEGTDKRHGETADIRNLDQ